MCALYSISWWCGRHVLHNEILREFFARWCFDCVKKKKCDTTIEVEAAVTSDQQTRHKHNGIFRRQWHSERTHTHTHARTTLRRFQIIIIMLKLFADVSFEFALCTTRRRRRLHCYFRTEICWCPLVNLSATQNRHYTRKMNPSDFACLFVLRLIFRI